MSYISFELPAHLRGALPSLNLMDFGQIMGHIIQQIHDGNFIQAIKLLRQASNGTLRDCKDFCDILRKYITPQGRTLADMQLELQNARIEAANLREENWKLKDAAEKARAALITAKDNLGKVSHELNALRTQQSSKNALDQLISADKVRITFESSYNVVAGGLNTFSGSLQSIYNDLLTAVDEDDKRPVRKTNSQWRDWLVARIGMTRAAIDGFNNLIKLFQDMGIRVTGGDPELRFPSAPPAQRTHMGYASPHVDPFDTKDEQPKVGKYPFTKH